MKNQNTATQAVLAQQAEARHNKVKRIFICGLIAILPIAAIVTILSLESKGMKLTPDAINSVNELDSNAYYVIPDNLKGKCFTIPSMIPTGFSAIDNASEEDLCLYYELMKDTPANQAIQLKSKHQYSNSDLLKIYIKKLMTLQSFEATLIHA